MSTRYKLTCSCGEQIIVEPRQAGRKIECPCGATVDVPTLMGMKQLPPLDEEAITTPDRSTDNLAENIGSRMVMLLVGIVLLIVGIGGAVYFVSDRPIHPQDMISEQFIEKWVATRTPLQLDDFWGNLKLYGADAPQVTEQELEIYDRKIMMNNIWLSVSSLLALAGIGIAIGAVIASPGKSTSTNDSKS